MAETLTITIAAKDAASAVVARVGAALNRFGSAAVAHNNKQIAESFSRMSRAIAAGPSSGIGKFVTQSIQGFASVAAAGARLAINLAFVPVKLLTGFLRIIPGITGVVGKIGSAVASGLQGVLSVGVDLAQGIVNALAGIIGTVANIGVSIAGGLIRAFSFAVEKISELFGKIIGAAGEALGKVGKLAAGGLLVAGGIAGWNIGKGLLDNAAIEKNAASLSKLFGTMEEGRAAAEYIDDFGDRFGAVFGEESIKKAVVSAGKFGFDWRTNLQTVADAAAATGTDVGDLMEQIGLVSTGEAPLRGLRRYGITEQTLEKRGIQFEKTKTGERGEVAPGQGAQLAAAVLAEFQARYQGATQQIESASPFTHLLNQLRDLRQEVTKPMFDVIHSALQRLSAAWDRFKMSETFVAAKTTIQDFLSGAAAQLVSWIEGLPPMLDRIDWSKIQETATGAWNAIKDAIGWAKDTLSEMWDLATRIDFGAVRDNLVNALVEATSTGLTVFGRFVDSLASGFAGFIDSAGKQLQGLLAPLTQSTLARALGLGNVASGAMEKIGDVRGTAQGIQRRGIGGAALAANAREYVEGFRPWGTENAMGVAEKMKPGERKSMLASAPGEGQIGQAVETVSNWFSNLIGGLTKTTKTIDVAWPGDEKKQYDYVNQTGLYSQSRGLGDHKEEEKREKEKTAWEKLMEGGEKLSGAGDKLDGAADKLGGARPKTGRETEAERQKAKYEAQVEKQWKNLREGRGPGLSMESQAAYREAQRREGRFQAGRRDEAFGQRESQLAEAVKGGKMTEEQATAQREKLGKQFYGKKGWAKREAARRGEKGEGGEAVAGGAAPGGGGGAGTGAPGGGAAKGGGEKAQNQTGAALQGLIGALTQKLNEMVGNDTANAAAITALQAAVNSLRTSAGAA